MSKIDKEKAGYLYKELQIRRIDEGDLITVLPNIEYVHVLIEALGEALRKKHNIPFFGEQTRVMIHYVGGKPLEFKVKKLLAKEGYIGPVLNLQTTLLSWQGPSEEKEYKTIEVLGSLEFLATATLSSSVLNEQIALAVLLTIRREDESQLVVLAEYRLIMDAEAITHQIRSHQWEAVKTIILKLGYPLEGGAIGEGRRG